MLALKVKVARPSIVYDAGIGSNLADFLDETFGDEAEADDGNGRRCKRLALAVPIQVPPTGWEGQAELIKGIA